MPAVAAPVIDLALPHPRRGKRREIATLGPAGTSSEQSAGFLADYLGRAWQPSDSLPPQVALHPRYEDAADAVIEGSSDLLLVANAYHAASTFYMSSDLRFAGAFLFDTPLYGIATQSGTLPARDESDDPLTIASHPAPIPLVGQLLAGSAVSSWHVEKVNSTSSAAIAAAQGTFDAALTTEPAAKLHGLTFATRTRPIRMLWSVFSAARGAVEMSHTSVVGRR